MEALMPRNLETERRGPVWYDTGLQHVWLPYSQMKTAAAPLPVARTHGCRIVLADGRELVDGIASWWTACHGYNHPYIRAAVEQQLAIMPHVMFGGLAHEQALTLARDQTLRGGRIVVCGSFRVVGPALRWLGIY